MKMVSLLALIFCLLTPLTASAAKGGHAGRAGESMGAAQSSSPLKVRNREQAVALVKQRYQGQVLKVQSSQSGGRSGYKVKLLSEGLVFYVFVDAQSGSISRN